MKILALIFISLLLFSCSETEEKGMIEESWEIINGYVDTLEWSIGDARAAAELINKQQENLKNNLQNQ